MKIASVVTLYHPDKSTLENIGSYLPKTGKTYVFDNTEKASFLKRQFDQYPALAYFHSGENEGIAKVLNKAARMAIAEGYDWLLMMDQDSKFEGNRFDEYIKSVEAYGQYDGVAMLGVNDDDPEKIPAKAEPLITDQLITSGTLLNLSLFTQIGAFDENLFIDSVDHDYSIRVLQHGYKMIKFPHIHLSHSIGKLEKRSSIKTLFLIKKLKRIHPPVRCYYMYRNLLYLQQKYKNSNIAFIKSLVKIVEATLWRNIFYGTDTWQRIQYMLMARQHFRKNRMGKLVHN